MKLLRFISKDIINSLGYEVRRVPRAAEVSSTVRSGIDPVTFQYMPRVRGSAVIEIRLQDTRGLNCLGLPFRPACHPFVRTALAAKTGLEATSKVRSILEEFYGSVQPATAREAVDVTLGDAPGLQGVPAAGWVYPWADKSVEETLRGRQTAMGLDALQYGKMLSFSEGLTAFGPVGAKKLNLEVERIQRLIASIATNGFDLFNRRNPLKVIGLRRGDNYRWIVLAGHHRFAACAAFSIAAVPAMVVDIVRYEDCSYWPQVVSGIYTVSGARAVFDRLFEGVPARVCNGWLQRKTAQHVNGTPFPTAALH
ncbi:ParB/RepB/Spo0J family partition protein [Mesorhizobium sp. M0293]|uniref:ParB N-terminal domain-containing protein n=1 Tax=unclassified Mesorhizobium TaxID=325217 RepID=UPI00333AAE59